MAKQMPLHAELSNCLAAYKDTFERILECIINACNQKKHDSSITIQVQDLLSIDAELKGHLKRMDKWNSRQKEINDLEQELKYYSDEVNNFAQNLLKSQMALKGFLSVSNKLHNDVIQRQQNPSQFLSSSSDNTNQFNLSNPYDSNPA